jgi:hypothetical protein
VDPYKKLLSSAPGDATFMTATQVPKTDEDLTDEALLRKYDELKLKDTDFGQKKKKGTKPIYENLED